MVDMQDSARNMIVFHSVKHVVKNSFGSMTMNNQCGDDCKGECSGEVTGIPFCPHAMKINPCEVCSNWWCKLDVVPVFPCANKIRYDAETKGVDYDELCGENNTRGVFK